MQVLEEFFPLRRHKIVTGSARMEMLMQEPLGRAALRIPCLLVVGTNGKGTVSLLLEHLLLKAQMRVGVYSSPHFIDPLERIRTCGKMVDTATASWARDQVVGWVEKYLPDATFFEITTAVALLCFESSQLDFCIIEAGLGGRLDSTNALAPVLTVLTSVGLDHVQLLGSTLDSIAYEKAMASRRNRPLVTGFLEGEAWIGVKKALTRTGAYVAETASLNETAAFSETDNLNPRRRNAVTALGVLSTLRDLVCRHSTLPKLKRFTPALAKILGKDQREALLDELTGIALPGRFDLRVWRNKVLILDNAHNAAATRALMRQYQESEFGMETATKKYVLIFGALLDKDYKESFRILASNSCGGAVLLFEHENGLQRHHADNLIAEHAKLHPENVEACASFTTITLADLETWLSSQNCSGICPILITGSFALVGQVMKELQIMPSPAGT
jgi:dihydrofolate synthase/folylpolyglutamate synthase